MRRYLVVCIALLPMIGRGQEVPASTPVVAATVPAAKSIATGGPGVEVAGAAGEFAGPWNFGRALQRALEANPDLLAAKYQVEREEGVRIQVRSRMLPRLTLTASTDERDSDLIDRSPFEFSLPPTAQSAVAEVGYDVRLEVRQVIFDGLNVWNETRRQRMIEKRAYLAFLDMANRVTALVRQGCDAILMRQNILAIERRRIANLNRLVESTARRLSVGEIAQLESLRAQSELESAKAELVDAEQRLIVAKQSFVRLLQLPDTSQPVEMVGTLEMRVFDLSLDRALAQALTQRPDLEAAEIAVKGYKLQQRAQMAEYLPKLEVYAAISERTSYYNSGRTLDGWTIGAVGRWNIFDGWESRGRSRAIAADRRIAEVRLAELGQSISSRLRELYQSLEQSRVAVAAQDLSVSFANRALEQAQLLYDAGQISLEQVLLSEVVARRAEYRYQETIFNYNVAVSQIEYSIGAKPEGGVGADQEWKR